VEYNAITAELKSIAVNLNTWIEKLPYYLSVNKECKSFSNLLDNANSLLDIRNSLLDNLKNLSIDSANYATYIQLSFVGDNQNLTGESLFLGGIDSTGNGRGSIEVNAFLRTYDSTPMYGNASLNYQITSTTSTPDVCKISSPRYFLGTNNPFTKFSITPLSEGKCLLNFEGNIEGRNDLIGTSTTWISIVRPDSKVQEVSVPTTTNTSKPVSPTIEDDGAEEDFYAILKVSKRTDGKYRLELSSNIVEEQLIITATKKGSKSIVYKAETSEFGDVSIITSRKLAGFTLTVRFDGERLTSVKAK
jgi:hypothetical protein